MTGIATVSEGEALNWYGGGKTEVTTASNLDVTYGVKTEVTVGFKSDFTIAGHNDIAVGSKFDASLAFEMSLKKNSAIESSADGEFYAMDSYVGTVGASAAQLAAAKTLRTATFILLAAQTTAMVLATANATAGKVMASGSKSSSKSESGSSSDSDSGSDSNSSSDSDKESDTKAQSGSDTETDSGSGGESGSGSESGGSESGGESEEEIKVPGTNFNLGYMTSIATIAATIAPALLVVYGKIKELGETNSPAGVFSMDADGGIFLGTRAMAPPSPTSGLLLNSSKAQLSASTTDLGYNKPPGGSSIIGFNESAGSVPNIGSRLEVCNDGATRVYGSSFQANLVAAAGVSSHTVNAQQHFLTVTAPASAVATGPALNLDATGAQLKGNDTNSVSAQPTNVTAVSGGPTGSVMRLTPTEACLGAAGNNLTVNATGVTLTYGESKVLISAMGISFGDDLTVLNPGAPGISFAGLESAVADVTALKVDTEAKQTAITVLNDKYQALDAAVTRVSDTLIATRNRLKTVAARAFSPSR